MTSLQGAAEAAAAEVGVGGGQRACGAEGQGDEDEKGVTCEDEKGVTCEDEKGVTCEDEKG